MTTSFEMLTLTDELVAMMNHMMPSINIGEDTLLLDEIDRVGPGGSYLDSPETLDHFRDFWYPDLISRDIRNQWSQKGATTLAQRLHEKVSRIIREHQPECLSKEQKSKVWEIAASG
jgi:trimethylamine--corrinoid protein Co-methyltransferase